MTIHVKKISYRIEFIFVFSLLMVGCQNQLGSLEDNLKAVTDKEAQQTEVDQTKLVQKNSDETNFQTDELFTGEPEIPISDTGVLYEEKLFLPQTIELSYTDNEVLTNYMKAPDEFLNLYDIDVLYQNGIYIQDMSEQEFICFNHLYTKEILPGIYIGQPVAQVKTVLGEPQFNDDSLDYIGYRTNDFYFALKGKEVVEKVVFTKVYLVPPEYDAMAIDFAQLSSIAEVAGKYPGYRFSGQYARGGSSLVYPYGIEVHDYGDRQVYIYTNFPGKVENNDAIVYTMRDSYEATLRKFFYRNYFVNQSYEGAVSPDGLKNAFSYTWITLYEHNKLYITALDDSFAPRIIPTYWVQWLEWLDENVLLYANYYGVYGYDLRSDEIHCLVIDRDSMDIDEVYIDKQNQIITVQGTENYTIDYSTARVFTYEISASPK